MEAPKDLAKRIVQRAVHFAGLYETANNAAWDDPTIPGPDPRERELIDALREVGWASPQPYCMALVAATYRAAYEAGGAPPEAMRRVRQALTLSAMQSWERCEALATKRPEPGAVFFMQLGSSWKGHAGIVIRPGNPVFSTVEGNTSAAKTTAQHDRDGDGIFCRTRRLDFGKSRGLWLRGFLPPDALWEG